MLECARVMFRGRHVRKRCERGSVRKWEGKEGRDRWGVRGMLRGCGPPSAIPRAARHTQLGLSRLQLGFDRELAAAASLPSSVQSQRRPTWFATTSASCVRGDIRRVPRPLLLGPARTSTRAEVSARTCPHLLLPLPPSTPLPPPHLHITPPPPLSPRFSLPYHSHTDVARVLLARDPDEEETRSCRTGWRRRFCRCWWGHRWLAPDRIECATARGDERAFTARSRSEQPCSAARRALPVGGHISQGV